MRTGIPGNHFLYLYSLAPQNKKLCTFVHMFVLSVCSVERAFLLYFCVQFLFLYFFFCRSRCVCIFLYFCTFTCYTCFAKTVFVVVCCCVDLQYVYTYTYMIASRLFLHVYNLCNCTLVCSFALLLTRHIFAFFVFFCSMAILFYFCTFAHTAFFVLLVFL